ncbi:MAG: anti-sigma factor antagonist [Spartobacteria bacterium]|nr:anti-sigma factor antagonist [Spartobacteria bacterium]
MAVTFEKNENVGVVKVTESLTAATADQFRDRFVNWMQAEPDVKNYVIDLEGVGVMDSAGLGALMVALKRVTEHGGDLRVACLQKKPRMVFEITRAYKVFEIFDTLEDAVEASR